MEEVNKIKQPAPVLNERIAFESWAGPERYEIGHKSESGEYLSGATLIAWQAWQARAVIAAHEAKQAQVGVEATVDIWEGNNPDCVPHLKFQDGSIAKFDISGLLVTRHWPKGTKLYLHPSEDVRDAARYRNLKERMVEVYTELCGPGLLTMDTIDARLDADIANQAKADKS